MLKIVLKRLRGRRGRRDLLSLVLFLSFLFMISALLFFHNQAVNAQIGREKTYGNWENALYFSDEKTVEEIKNLPEVTSSGQMRIIGRDKRFGLVASVSKDLQDLGSFRLKEGRMPEAPDEIVVEEKQLIIFTRYDEFVKDLESHPEVLKKISTALWNYYGSVEREFHLGSSSTHRWKCPLIAQ